MRNPLLSRGTLFLCAGLLLSACATEPTSAPSRDVAAVGALPGLRTTSSARGPGERGRLIVAMKNLDDRDLATAVERGGGRVERRVDALKLLVVRGLSDSAAAALAARADVANVIPDLRVQWIPRSSGDRRTAKRPARLPRVDQSTAAFYPDFQWNMKVTRANDAWLRTPEGRGASVYVLDTGIDPTHADLEGLVDLARSRSFSETEPDDVLDREAHGTFVSAIIASNGIGVASVAPLARLVAVKVLDHTGSGSFSDIIAGIIYAAEQGADVINMSLGAYVDRTVPEQRQLAAHLEAAIAFARLRGAVVVASAGNDALNLLRDIPAAYLEVPAELPGVISVGATAPTNQMGFDQLASYSNFGFARAFIGGGVEIFAPGGDLLEGGDIRDLIISACSQYAGFGCGPLDYLLGGGTSFASPMVAGAAAVNRSVLGRRPAASFLNVRCILEGADRIGPGAIFGNGRLNVLKAAHCAD